MRWIRVKEWLPTEDKIVLVYARGHISIACIKYEMKNLGDEKIKVPLWVCVKTKDYLIPSHWTLLPDYPRFDE